MKPSVILLFLSLVFSALPALSQTPASDSLRRLLRQQPLPDTTRVRRLLMLVRQVKIADVPQALQLSNEALELARQLSDRVGEAQALLELSALHRRQTKYEEARRYARHALRLFERLSNKQGQAKAWLQLSLIDMVAGNLKPAVDFALKGLPLAEQVGDQQTQAYLHVSMGDAYVKMENYEEAIPILQSVLKSGQQLGDKQLVLQALNGLGESFQKLRKWPQALHYHQRALKLSQQLGDKVGEAADETNLAEVYRLQGNYAAALAHGLRARRMVKATHDDFNLPSVELTLARIYLHAQELDSTLALAQDGLKVSLRTRSVENARDASDILAQVYAQQGNFAQAYRHRTMHLAYNDSLSGEEIQRQTSALRHNYELEKKQAQITMLTQARQLERQKRNALLGGLGGVVALAALLARNIFLKQRTNRHLNEKNQQIEAHSIALDRTLEDLKTTQTQLVQREKMASLGELTAGVAHEMQNPLNFVTNFADLSVELVAELEEELAQEPLTPERRQTIQLLLQELVQNQAKIHQHGHRADGIVKRMLEHSRGGSGQRQPTNLNALCEESLRLAYHSWRAKHPDFTAALTTELDPHVLPVPVVPQDVNSVLLNILTNAFYAVGEKRQRAGDTFHPEVTVHTQRTTHAVRISVRDNGLGISEEAKAKIFQPFFTTKPTGEGTGLGLSLSYDIITKGHGGTLTVESKEGEYTEFVISLPVKPQSVFA
ncbi:tetratricopeptide repeat-containing sensor histidine kinase [Hymenobacter jejuensis]|uniref:histidine kinase n=1 Tax=Hymenobacter jejuensis TaxID=2502781 RepID=A0A5B7ZVA4_9BACT|nr:tetratricopeptide repeat protein [Hymenobacter jejuensis]QDA58920.1 tetratricopeptide repeat protein [Hymenobacter jejuensis]